jgi:hypothetical protein
LATCFGQYFLKIGRKLTDTVEDGKLITEVC